MIITSIRESQLYSRHLARHINVPSDFRYYINSFENVNYYFGSEYKFISVQNTSSTQSSVIFIRTETVFAVCFNHLDKLEVIAPISNKPYLLIAPHLQT